MVSPHVRLVRAPNPSAMTLSGTNSYLIDCGDGNAICVDPGPAVRRHVDALTACAREAGLHIAAIALTHAHPDHAPAAPLLAKETGAPVYAHPLSEFTHDLALADRETLRVGACALQAVDTPGHTFDHLVFYEPRDGALFTGDVVLGEGYVVIAPPNGAMRPYQRTLQRLLEEFTDARVILGGHGEPVREPRAKLRDYLAHRSTRERELLEALAHGPQTIPALVQRIYRDTNPVLWPAAARQMLAYLLPLEQEGRVRSRELAREMSAQEHAILNPEWETIVGAEHARTVEEELGAMLRLDAVREYTLA